MNLLGLPMHWRRSDLVRSRPRDGAPITRWAAVARCCSTIPQPNLGKRRCLMPASFRLVQTGSGSNPVVA
eukprot:4842805-Amphidinium_carterae.2